ncbi:MAG: nicotinate-nucleotide adenylyltransferase [Desulfobacterales bacterium]
MKKIGLFGGTFNPIHFAHLRTALEVKEEFSLDSIVLIPSAIPPHKKPDHIAEAEQRLHMIRLAIADDPDFSFSDIELQRTGPSFTIETVHYFSKMSDPAAELFFVIGSDAFCELDTWKSYVELLASIPFIVMIRPETPCPDPESKSGQIENFLHDKISKDYVLHRSKNGYFHPELQPVYIQKVTAMDISSTRIRTIIRRHGSIRYLVPQTVETFILTKGLYR